MKKTFTPEQKKEYYASIYSRWEEAKKASVEEKYIQAYEGAIASGMQCSSVGFCFTLIEMERLGLRGVPYMDAKTFGKWKEEGFLVKKGEKSFFKGIAWTPIDCSDPKDPEQKKTEEKFIPKLYSLFHRSQVAPA